MFKRPANTLTAAQTRKRRRNGVSSSRTVLESAEVPSHPGQAMRVWKTNVGNHRATERSMIPLQPKASGAQPEDQTLDEAEPMFVEVDTTTAKKKKRSRGNDSVSSQNLCFS